MRGELYCGDADQQMSNGEEVLGQDLININ